MNYLSLFSGAGGGDLACQHLLGWTCKGYVEIDDYCQRLLRQRQDDGALDHAPIFGDIKAFIGDGYASAYSGLVDCVTGGFPCQDISTAGGGGQKGITGPKSGLWFTMAGVIGEIRPKFVFMENSPALVFRGLELLLGDLAQMGFDARWGIVSAGDVGARHERERIWILGQNRDAYSDTTFPIIRFYEPSEKSIRAMSEGVSPMPAMGRKNNGLPYWMDRLRAIGNAQVPAVAATAWRLLTGEIE